ncbi:cytosol aminopeptidase-like [Chrysoperla carnea]|uniref:cytosol aminopeptidase-like n=1 Tax=Chrysoperla carnea TaxID=189513 RepID=UPI001D07C052|nr:cytosol aminopeptidase-like [Chrysoperla carnea]XP_044727492.1 cytosol aminopeptidase-like [Chrysoperla carnea]
MNFLGHCRKLITRRGIWLSRRCYSRIEQLKTERRSMCPTDLIRRGAVFGIYYDPKNTVNPYGKLTETAEKFNQRVCGRMEEMLFVAGMPVKKGEIRTLFDLDPDLCAIVIVGLGEECQGYDIAERMDEGKEAIRQAAALGCQELQRLNTKIIYVESFGHAESAAEGASLGSWIYQTHLSKEKQLIIPDLILYEDCDWTGWQIGLQKAAAQNLTRQLMETPANELTPSMCAQNAVEILCKSGINVEVKVKAWAETLNMNAFVAASKGSCEPPIFLEISYYGAHREERPVVLIGKGLTFNSGGINLKSCDGMRLMRGDMAGAANVIAVCRAVASLELPINVRGLIPLCENMPGCSAMRPGDIVHAMNGKSIEIENTRNAGRLILADALVYAQTFWPRFILDVGTMTEDVYRGLGTGACGVFTNSETLWKYMEAASMHTGDRVWRLPLWNHFTHLITHRENVDVRTQGDEYGESCKVAAFLNEFVPCGEWIHLDTYGVMYEDGDDPKYLRQGMSGRPTRTLIEFLSQMVCQRPDEEKPNKPC